MDSGTLTFARKDIRLSNGILLEPGVPIPERRNHKNRRTNQYTLALREMQVGESFLFVQALYAVVTNAVTRYRQHAPHGNVYLVRGVGDGMYRVWRVA